jgi:hypothetical protein
MAACDVTHQSSASAATNETAAIHLGDGLNPAGSRAPVVQPFPVCFFFFFFFWIFFETF